MSWDWIIETGSGRISWRLQVDGIGIEFVTHPRMVKAAVTESALNLSADPASQTWTAGTGTATSGEVDPIGGTDAFELEDTNAAVLEFNQQDDAGTTNTIAVGNDILCELWVKQDASATHFAEISIRDSVSVTNAFYLHLSNGWVKPRVGPDLETIQATPVEIGAISWWRVTFTMTVTNSGSHFFRVYPARGLASSWTTGSRVWDPDDSVTNYGSPSDDATATGSVVVYAGTVRDLTTYPDTRERLLGLNTEGLSLSERTDLVRAKWEPSGMTLKIADIDNAATALFHTDPTAITYLDQEEFTSTEGSMGVLSTSGFESEGPIYVGTETLYYRGTSANFFRGLTRGYWSSDNYGATSPNGQAKQYHYTQTQIVSEDKLYKPEVTNKPVVFEGRRCYLYAYGPGDDLQGDGTRVWSGLISTDPKYDGSYWSFTVDPLSRLFAYELGADLADPFSIRGIYLPYTSPLTILLSERATAVNTSAITVSNQFKFSICGFWQDRQELIDTLDDLVSNGTSGWSTTVNVVGTPGGGVGLTYLTPSSGEKWIDLYLESAPFGSMQSRPGWLATDDATEDIKGTDSATANNTVDPDTQYYSVYIVPDGEGNRKSADGVFRGSIDGNATESGTVNHHVYFAPAMASTKYTYISTESGYNVANRSSGLSTALTPGRIYPDRVLGYDDRLSVNVNWPELDPSPLRASLEVPELVYANAGFIGFDQSDNWFELPRPTDLADGYDPRGMVGSDQNMPEFQLVRTYKQEGSYAEFVQQLLDDREAFLNLGLTPDIRPDDLAKARLTDEDVSLAGYFTPSQLSDHRTTALAGFEDSWFYELETAARPSATDSVPLLSQRGYIAADAIQLDEMQEHELRLIGAYPHLVAEGRIQYSAIKVVGAVSVPSATLTAAKIIVQNQWFDYAPSALGIFNQVQHKYLYDPIEDEHLGEFNFKWALGFSRVPGGRLLEIAPKSLDPVGDERQAETRIRLAQRVLGTFGAPYAYLTVEVPFTEFGVYVGDIVRLDWSKVPNAEGGLGVFRSALVVERSFTPREALGRFVLLVNRTRLGNYVPAAKIAEADITGTSGTTGPFTGSFSLSDYFPSDTDASDFLQVGDDIRLFKWGSLTKDETEGTITAVGTDSITFTTDTNWSYSGSDWVFGGRRSSEYASADNLASYCFEADSTAQIEYTDVTLPRFVFSPS